MAARDQALELLRGAFGDHLAAIDQRDPVGQLVGLLQILRGEEDGGAARDQLADQPPDRATAARVEPGGRLVEEKHLRVADQAHRDVEPAAHAAGVGRCRFLRGVHQVELLDQRSDSAFALGPAEMVQCRHHRQVLLGGEEVVHRGELTGDADRGANRIGFAGDVVACDPQFAVIGTDQCRKDLHRGGFPGPVRAEQRKDSPGRHIQIDAVEHLVITVGLAQSGRRDRRWAGAGHHVFLLESATPWSLSR